MTLSLLVLGPFELLWHDQPLRFATNPARALLADLAVEPERAHSRELLAALLWPNQPQATAYTNLRQTLARARKAFPAESAVAACLTITPQTVQFNRAAVTSDLVRCDALLAACAAHAHPDHSTCQSCLDRLQQAALLYRGEFLQGLFLSHSQPFEEWLLLKREMLHRQALDLFYTLTRAFEAAGDYPQMCHYAARQLALEPWREDAHRQLMRAFAYSGQRTAALAQYETCCHVLQQELGIEPEIETRALYERIQAGELSPVRLTAAPSAQNLPAQLTPFVGRESELAEITARLQQPEVRLLTLVGAGGMGKSRLALELARSRLVAFPDGVVFVSLAPLSTASAIAPAIAAAMGLTLHGGDPKQLVLLSLRDKCVLLILDNFEHLLAPPLASLHAAGMNGGDDQSGASIVVDMLQAAPQVQLIATSRERLNLRGEHLYRVQGMEYAPSATLEQAVSSSAVRLFMQSARRTQPSFRLSTADLSALLRICQLVQGMPLGLELAAAWVETLPLEVIAIEIEQSADFLASEWRDAPARQRSMRAAFAWSWQLLNDTERQVFRQLSAFRGGFTREAAAIVGATLRMLTSLVDKSLVRRMAADRTSAGRYEIHELLRQFAAEQLDAAERAMVEARHGTYYLAFVAARSRRLGRDQPREAAAEIQGEIDNVRQAWNWAVAETRATELAQAAYGWWQFCLLTGQDPESRHMFGLAIARLRSALDEGSIDTLSRRQHERGLSTLLAIHANHLFSNAPYDQMAAEAREAIRLGAASQGLEGETLGHYVLGRALQELGQRREARAMWERTIQLAHAYQSLDPSSELLHEAEWLAYIWLFGSLLFFEDYAGGRACVVEALRISQSLHKRRAELFSLASLAMIDFYMGDDLSARQRYEQVIPLARALEDPWAEMRVQRELSEVLRVQGAYAQADTVLGAVVATAREIGVVYEEILALAALVRLHCQLGDTSGAASWREQLVQRIGGIGVTRDCQAEALRACAVYALYSGDDQQALADAERAWQIAELVDIPNFRADSAVILGHARARMDQPDLAAAAYQQAIACYITIGNTAMVIEPRAGLVQLALAQDDRVQAQILVEMMLPVLSERPRARVLTPFYAYLICYDVLEAVHDSRAATVLQTAQRLLQDYAEQIPNTMLRRSFLENVATHRELLRAGTRAAARLVPSSDA
jgi:predicted ATPase/DNA-binding SARP family transcriptional activator